MHLILRLLFPFEVMHKENGPVHKTMGSSCCFSPDFSKAFSTGTHKVLIATVVR